MSYQAINWAISEKKTKGSTRVVLFILADMANEKNQCYPSLATIAERANIDRRQVIRIIKDLEAAGIISVFRRKESEGRNQSNIFTILGVVTCRPLPSDMQTTTPSDMQTTTPSDMHVTQTIINNHNKKSSRNHTPASNARESGTPQLHSIALALAQVSGLDLEANKARIFKEAKELSKAQDVTPEKIISDYGAGGLWYQVDFRGKSGAPPAINQVRATWGALRMYQSSSSKYQTGFDTSRKTIESLLQEKELNYGGL